MSATTSASTSATTSASTNYHQILKDNFLLVEVEDISDVKIWGHLYFINNMQKYCFNMSGIILLGKGIHNVVENHNSFKTMLCPRKICLYDNCSYFHDKIGDEHNYKSNLWTKLIHNKSSLDKSIENLKSYDTDRVNKYFYIHNDFMIHNIMITLLINIK